MHALRHARAGPAHPSEKNESCEARRIAGSLGVKTALRAFCPAMTTAFFEEESWPSSLLFLLVHRQHALRHQKAAENIYRRKDQRDKTKTARPGTAAADQRNADRQQRADHDHRRDRVGHRHQRRMQRRRHRPHYEIADEHREHENRQPEYEGVDGLRDMIHGGAPYAFGWKFGWMTAPSLVSAVALTSSSSQFTASVFVVLSIRVSMNEKRLRA